MSRKGYSKLLDWQKIYQFPLELDDYGSYAWSKNRVMSLMFHTGVADSERTKIVDSINGGKPYKIEHLTFEDIDFLQDGEYIFCIRGWGHLTGSGDRSESDAINIQNKFRDHIFKHLQ